MLSSDSSSDDEEPPVLIQSTGKYGIHIDHPGTPSPDHATFASQAKHPKWPDDLWETGTLIYDLNNPEKCIRIQSAPGDKMLKFDSRFESGNLSQAFHLTQDIYHLVLEYDQNKSGSCQWFYFKMSNIQSSTKYTFYISGFHKNSGVFSSGSKVFWYSEKQYQKDGLSWCRGGMNFAYGTSKHKKKDKRSTLQFQIRFPYDNDTVYLCYALPYTYTDLLRNLKTWASICPAGDFHTDVLCKTLGGKDCPTITITSHTSSIPLEERPCLFFTGRIHPGESNGSVVLHGLIDFLVSQHPGAIFLRDRYLIRIVPMINIDGVIEGFYRISLSGQDLNRVWTSPNPSLHPVVYNVKELIKKIASERPIAAYVDFHGHSRLHGTFAYGCPNDDKPELRDREKLLPRMLAFMCDAFSWANCVFSIPKERKSASRIVVRTEVDVVQSFTIETSFGGITSGPRGGLLYDELIWKELGAKTGEALFHMLLGPESPITSYVEQELYFLSPDDSDDARSVPEDYDIQYAAAPVEPLEQIPTLKKGRENSLLKLAAPTSFLTANARIITATPPGYCAPKWAQLQFTEN